MDEFSRLAHTSTSFSIEKPGMRGWLIFAAFACGGCTSPVLRPQSATQPQAGPILDTLFANAKHVRPEMDDEEAIDALGLADQAIRSQIQTGVPHPSDPLSTTYRIGTTGDTLRIQRIANGIERLLYWQAGEPFTPAQFDVLDDDVYRSLIAQDGRAK